MLEDRCYLPEEDSTFVQCANVMSPVIRSISGIHQMCMWNNIKLDTRTAFWTPVVLEEPDPIALGCLPFNLPDIEWRRGGIS